MNAHDNQSAATENAPSPKELDLIKKTFASLLLANKNFSLYPQGHTICINSIKQFHDYLKTYLKSYGNFKIEIERDQVVSKGKVVSSVLPEEGTLPFTLFRDGIRWLEFTKGIEMEEVQEILSIINKYTVLSAEPEGDIVTDFWESEFPHMEYEVANFLWGNEDEMGKSTSSLTGEKGNAPLREKKLVEIELESDPPIDLESLVLTQNEEANLQEMIRLEEEADITSYLDALLDSLLQHKEKENFKIILEVLSEEFPLSLARSEFTATLKILLGLKYILDSCKTEVPWAVSLIEEFLLTVSDLKSLSPLKDVWKNVDSDQAVTLRHIFKRLHPQAIHMLVLLLQQPKSLPFRQMLMDVIIFLSLKDMRPLASLLNTSDEKTLENLVPVLIRLNGEQSLKHLMKLVQHTSARVRQEAIKGLMQKGSAQVNDIFALIDDKDEDIRRLVLKKLGNTRDDVIEELLLNYLVNKKFNKDETEHIIECFRTLGQCGSSRSIPFLRKSLLKRVWMPGFQRLTKRRGAVIALIALKIPEAEHTLKKAKKSLYPSLRDIVKNAEQNA